MVQEHMVHVSTAFIFTCMLDSFRIRRAGLQACVAESHARVLLDGETGVHQLSLQQLLSNGKYPLFPRKSQTNDRYSLIFQTPLPNGKYLQTHSVSQATGDYFHPIYARDTSADLVER